MVDSHFSDEKAQWHSASRAKSRADKWHDETVVATRATQSQTGQSRSEQVLNRREASTAMFGERRSHRCQRGDELVPTTRGSNWHRPPSGTCLPPIQQGTSRQHQEQKEIIRTKERMPTGRARASKLSKAKATSKRRIPVGNTKARRVRVAVDK
jgi:hypothetical protein